VHFNHKKMRSKIYIKIVTGMVMTIMLVTGISVSAQDKADSMKNVTEEASIVKVGDRAPDFSVGMLDGKTIKLSDVKGKVVLLNFWATWCGPCMKEFKEIPDKILKRFEGNSDFVFIPVSRGETYETVRKKMNQLKESGIDFPVGLDSDKKVYDLYAKSYIPRNYLINKEGEVVFTSIGYEEEEFAELADTIERLLE
jgi:peroxiredoxin